MSKETFDNGYTIVSQTKGTASFTLPLQYVVKGDVSRLKTGQTEAQYQLETRLLMEVGVGVFVHWGKWKGSGKKGANDVYEKYELECAIAPRVELEITHIEGSFIHLDSPVNWSAFPGDTLTFLPLLPESKMVAASLMLPCGVNDGDTVIQLEATSLLQPGRYQVKRNA